MQLGKVTFWNSIRLLMVPRDKSELWQIMHYTTFYNVSDLFLPCCMQFTLSSRSPPDIRKVKPLLSHFTCSQHILLFESQSTFDIKGSQGVYVHTFVGRIAVKTGRYNWSKSQIRINNLIFYNFCQYIVFFRIYCFNCVPDSGTEFSSQLKTCRNRMIQDKWQCIPCWFVYLRKGGIWKKSNTVF